MKSEPTLRRKSSGRVYLRSLHNDETFVGSPSEMIVNYSRAPGGQKIADFGPNGSLIVRVAKTS